MLKSKAFAVANSLLLFFVQLFNIAKGAAPAVEIPRPHEYFPTKIKQLVQQANLNSDKFADVIDEYPTIDISPWLNHDFSTEEERKFVVKQVLEQATGAGSFNIIGHNITNELLDQLERSAKRFFDQDLESKNQYSKGNNKAGYVAIQEEQVSAIHETSNPYEQKDLREIFSMIYPSQYSQNVRGPDYFQINLNEYIEKIQPVETALTKIFSAALSLATGVDLPLDYLHSVEQSATGLLRSSRYSAMPSEYDGANRLLAHSDWSTFTIIYSTESGLEEVRDEKWVGVPMKRGQLYVTIGEVYAMWSNEVFTNNVHRVGSKAEKDRVSFSYFSDQGQIAFESDGIDPVCRSDEVAKFPRVSSGTHIQSYFSAMVGKDMVTE